MKTIKTQLQASNPDRVAAFEKGAQEFAKKIVGNFKDYEFYVGESMNPEGMVVLLVRFISFLAIKLKLICRTTERTVPPPSSPSGRTASSRLVIPPHAPSTPLDHADNLRSRSKKRQNCCVLSRFLFGLYVR